MRKQFVVCWSNEHACDSIGCQTYDEAYETALEIYQAWIDGFTGTLEDWNYMVTNCYVDILGWDGIEQEYVEYDGVTWEDCEDIGWYERDERYENLGGASFAPVEW